MGMEDDLAEDDFGLDFYPSPNRPNRTGLVALTIAVVVALAGAWVLARGSEASPLPLATGVSTPTPQPRATDLGSASHSGPRPGEAPPPTAPLPPLVKTNVVVPSPVASRAASTPIPAYWLGLINADRLADGKNPVAWDDLAAQVATAHAREMAEREYLSHWNLVGVGPDVRYGLAGGRDLAQENVYSYWTRYPDGTPGPINLEDQLRAAELALMNSPGHRANILDPVHTQVGVGYYYVASRGELRVAQLFINRYVSLEAVPAALALGAQLTIAGAASDAVSNIIIDVAWQPFPSPLTVVDLGKKPNSYAPDAKSITQYGDAVKTINGRFTHTVVLGVKPGYYHIRVFGDVQGAQHGIANVLVESR